MSESQSEEIQPSSPQSNGGPSQGECLKSFLARLLFTQNLTPEETGALAVFYLGLKPAFSCALGPENRFIRKGEIPKGVRLNSSRGPSLDSAWGPFLLAYRSQSPVLGGKGSFLAGWRGLPHRIRGGNLPYRCDSHVSHPLGGTKGGSAPQP